MQIPHQKGESKCRKSAIMFRAKGCFCNIKLQIKGNQYIMKYFAFFLVKQKHDLNLGTWYYTKQGNEIGVVI